MMRFQVRFSAFAAAALALCAASVVTAPIVAQSSSSSSSGTQVESPQERPAPAYVSIDPLAGVRYDNRYDISLGAAFGHIKPGPTQVFGANLGGLDLDASYWLTRRWGVEGTARAYLGTAGAAANPYNVEGPFVAEYIFGAGPEWLGPHNKHAALIAHAMFGGAYGDFEHSISPAKPSDVDFYNNQVAPAGVIGGHIDLNRSARWVFRITPDALWTDYNADYATNISSAGRHSNWNFGISVGAEYKFKKRR